MLIVFCLLIVIRSEENSLAAIMISILTISKDNSNLGLTRVTVWFSWKTCLFTLLPRKGWKIKLVRKPEKPQKIITTVQKLSNQCAYSWREFAKGILQAVLFTIFCFKWSVKEHCFTKILLAIPGTFIYENNYSFNSYKFSYKLYFILFHSFVWMKKEPYFDEVDGLVRKAISAVCL